jgi:hypothetical protein
MTHGPNIPHNPLGAAANQAMHAAREAKSPLMEKFAIGAMVMSAVVSVGLGAVQVARMITHDREKAEEKAYQRLRREREAEEREHTSHGHHAQTHGR